MVAISYVNVFARVLRRVQRSAQLTDIAHRAGIRRRGHGGIGE
jgi:hypothetical protein